MYHRTNSLAALNVKAGVKTREHDSRRKHCISREPSGYYFGKGYYSPNVRVDDLGATCYSLGLLPGAASTKGCWIFFLRKRLCAVRNCYWSEQFIARNKTKKPSDESPIDQEHRPGDRADQAHRAQLIARSIISSGCLLLVKSFSFLFTVFSDISILK